MISTTWPGNWRIFLVVAATILSGAFSSVRAAQNVTLAWDADTSSTTLAGYLVYYGTASGNYSKTVDVGNSNSVSIQALADNTTYYFVVTEYDALGVESAYSNEVSFVTVGQSAPTVSLANTAGSINGPANVTLTASASVPNGTVAKVAFYANSTEVGETTTAPYSVVWNNAQPGSYELTAVAYNASGASTVSDAVALNIVQFGVTTLQRSRGGCQLGIAGVAGSTYNVYYSNDLVQWTLLETVLNQSGTVAVNDPTANAVGRRFYKLQVVSSDSTNSGTPTTRAVLRTTAPARR